ncbi:cache domain-containing protein [Actinophytocola sp.]|uniref:cache domain-containing protein n=1 Tax=Actinophytocola sp. TaxID=1872138 RepID=UPI002D53C1E7|nr:cache domain-containing protein [Actinophytocola sp.]HYQ64134.1 cache domain-containing protein [Actinophytocola sp.]
MDGDEVVEQVSALVEGVFDRLKPVLVAAESLVDRPAVPAGDLNRLRPFAVGALGGLVVGAGYICAPHTLSDQLLGFEWWTANQGAAPRRLFISLDPASADFLDYTRQSWFTVPRDTGRRHVTGPYVDYLCTDEYTLTFTIPVRRFGSFAGVVGADVYVRSVERALRPKLRPLGGRAALVNAQGRVIVSNSIRQPTGSLVRAVDVPAWWMTQTPLQGGTTLRRCGDAPIALLI